MDLKDNINPEILLWNEFRKGNNSSFKEIYQNNIKSLFRYGLKFTSDRELIKDSIQELFVDLYNQRQSLGATDRIKPYLIICLKRKLIRLIKLAQKNVSLEPDEFFFLNDDSIETQMELDEREQSLKKMINLAMDKLSSRQKKAINMRFNEGLEYEEISKEMGLNYQSARNLIHRAVERMREVINP